MKYLQCIFFFCALFVGAVARRNHARSPLRSKHASFHHVMAAVEPYAEIVTSSSTALPVHIPQEVTPVPALVVPPAEEYGVGLQYIDKVYIWTLLGITIPVFFAYVVLAFYGNAKEVQGAFTAATAAIFIFYQILGLFINLRIDSTIGVSVASPLFAVTLALGWLFPEKCGWTITILAADFFLITLLYNMTAPLFGIYGFLGILPGYADASAPARQILYTTSMFVAAILFFLVQVYAGAEKKCPPVVSRNRVSSFVSAFYATSAFAYCFAIAGFTVTTAFEPIGFTSMPVLFAYNKLLNYVFLFLWATLAIGGFYVQNKRDKIKGLEE